jgi:hypothetical protein
MTRSCDRAPFGGHHKTCENWFGIGRHYKERKKNKERKKTRKSQRARSYEHAPLPLRVLRLARFGRQLARRGYVRILNWRLSGFDGTASFETPPPAAPQDEALPHGKEAEGRLEP